MYSGGEHRMDYIEDLISVVMPTYKRSEKLSRAIESVLEQSYRNIELLLVNDNEPDDEYTKELKRQLIKYEKDPRFHLVIQEKHINGAAARNVGIKKPGESILPSLMMMIGGKKISLRNRLLSCGNSIRLGEEFPVNIHYMIRMKK